MRFCLPLGSLLLQELMRGVDPDLWTHVTADLPGIGGVLKQRPEDFLVDEVPAYPPSGEGDHLYLIVEKRKRLTSDVARILRQHFNANKRAIGYAGLKDKHAVTRQVFTIEHADPKLIDTFEDDFIKIVAADKHHNKVKRGHLRGNRFVIKVREVEPTAVLRAKPIVDKISRCGAPNYFGEQRFGYRRNNPVLGKYLLQGEWQAFLDELLGRPMDHEQPIIQEARGLYEAEDYKGAIAIWPTVHRFERQAVGPLSRGAPATDAVNGIDETQRHLLVSAFQSAIFNRLLTRRVSEGWYDQLMDGDLAFLHHTRRVFEVPEASVEQGRCDALEISPSGPMWGRKMIQPTGDAMAWELEALEETGLSPTILESGEYTPNGSRRPLRMPVMDAEVSGGVDEDGAYVKVSFELPRGCYATTVMREVMKTTVAEENGG